MADRCVVLRAGVVFVSGATGAVGSPVGQIAKLSGASRVIGSAGSTKWGQRMAGWPRAGEITYRETTVDGPDEAPRATHDLLGGHNPGT